MGELRLGHLQGEEGDGLSVLGGDVLGDVAHEGGLTERRPSGDHDQVPRLEAAELRVEVAKARRRPGHVAVALRQGLQAVDLVVEDIRHAAEIAGALLVGDLEQKRLGSLDQLLGLALAVVHGLLDLLGGSEQPSQKRVLFDDLRVVARVSRHRNGRRQLGDRVLATGLRQLATLGELLGDGQGVDRLTLLVEAGDRPEHDPVALAVEVLVLEAHVQDHRRDRSLGDHHRSEHGGLGLEVLGWDVGLGGRHVAFFGLGGAHPAPSIRGPEAADFAPSRPGSRGNHTRRPPVTRVPANWR